jgi:hypothetical protein
LRQQLTDLPDIGMNGSEGADSELRFFFQLLIAA